MVAVSPSDAVRVGGWLPCLLAMPSGLGGVVAVSPAKPVSAPGPCH